MLTRSVAGSTGGGLVFGRAAAWCIPAAGKQSKTGEDGFYIARSGRSLGVSDGVGGWVEKRVDPSRFTRTFMRYALERAEEVTGPTPSSSSSSSAAVAGRPFTSHAIMQHAFERVLLDKHIGSCTALFATLESDEQAPVQVPTHHAKPARSKPPAGPFAILNMANVGDCQLAVVRPGAGTVFISQEQLRGHNFPFQLGAEAESPSDGTVSDFVTAQHDIVVMGSDGLFVNVDREELLTAVNEQLRASQGSEVIDCAALATSLGKLARRNYLKPDDITVVVAQVLLQSKKEQHTPLPKYSHIDEYFEQHPV